MKVEQVSIQGDHIHLLIRAHRRQQFHFFFRVLAGQVAQRFQKEGFFVTDTPANRKRGVSLWRLRPFTRLVRGWRAHKIVRDYIQLNEQEALGKILYQKKRLKGLSSAEWELLWR